MKIIQDYLTEAIRLQILIILEKKGNSQGKNTGISQLTRKEFAQIPNAFYRKTPEQKSPELNGKAKSQNSQVEVARIFYR
jgi:hypothetical protein